MASANEVSKLPFRPNSYGGSGCESWQPVKDLLRTLMRREISGQAPGPRDEPRVNVPPDIPNGRFGPYATVSFKEEAIAKKMFGMDTKAILRKRLTDNQLCSQVTPGMDPSCGCCGSRSVPIFPNNCSPMSTTNPARPLSRRSRPSRTASCYDRSHCRPQIETSRPGAKSHLLQRQ